jgi:hypothetical protein
VSSTPFDPRRLADLANRVGPPAAYAAPRPEPVEEPGPDDTTAGEAGVAGGGSGHPRVDAALDELTRAASLAPHEQIAAYESVHRTLQETLRSIEQN